MSNKIKEGCWVGVFTIVHMIMTVLELGKMPIVIFYHMQAKGGMAFVLWMVYVAVLYFVIVIYESEKEVSVKEFFKAVGFGLCMATVKGVIDTIGEIICAFENRFIPIEIQVEVLIFGIILFFTLHCKVAKKKIVFEVKKVMVPVIMILLVMIVYITQVCSNLRDYITYNHYAVTSTELYNLDTYIAHKILLHNTWSYVVLYMLLWWCVQRITVAKEKGKMSDKKKLEREDRVVITFILIWGICGMIFECSGVFSAFPIAFFRDYWKSFWTWLSYGMGMYLVIKLAVGQKTTTGKLVLNSFICGGVVYLCKAILDMIFWVVESNIDMLPWMWGIGQEVLMIAYAILVMKVLFTRITKSGRSCTGERIESSIVVMLMATFLYLAWCIWCLLQVDWDYKMFLSDFNPSEYEATILMTKMNIPVCVLFCMAFWKILRKVE